MFIVSCCYIRERKITLEQSLPAIEVDDIYKGANEALLRE